MDSHSLCHVGRIAAVVEITSELDAETQMRLLTAAYVASRSGVAILMLKGVSRESVDRQLDPVVRSVGLNVQGVVYMDEESPPGAALAAATVIVAATDHFRARLLADGMSYLNAYDFPPSEPIGAPEDLSASHPRICALRAM